MVLPVAEFQSFGCPAEECFIKYEVTLYQVAEVPLQRA